MSTDIRGGSPPYKITLSFEPELIKPIVGTSIAEGKFEKQLTMPEVNKDEKMIIDLLISDEVGKGAKVKSEPIEIKNIS